MRPHQFIAAAIMLGVFALPGFGQARSGVRNTFAIGGNVRDDTDQHTMENVRVDLKLSTGVPVNTTFTRGNGEFEFSGLGNGEYVVEVEVKDYEPFRQVVMINNNSRLDVSVFLSKPMEVRRATSQGSISAHELSVPRKAHDEYEKGLELLYSKADYRRAITQFEKATKDFATFYEAYAQEGNAYLSLKDLPHAEEAMRKSIDLSGGQYPDALFMLAGLLNDTDRYADAVAIAHKGADAEAGSWRAPFELARAYLGLKQLDDAEKHAAEARDLKPDNPPVYLMLANIHIQKRDYPALMKDLEGYLKLVPSGPQAEQARQTLEELKTDLQQAKNQEAVAPTASRQTAQPAENPGPPPPDPDNSGLPSLPPPTQNAQ